MSGFRTIARKELGFVFSERTILFAVTIQFLVAGFSSFLSVGLAALVNPDAIAGQGEPTIAVNKDTVPSDLARILDAGGMIVMRVADDDAVRAAFRAGQADASLLTYGTYPTTVKVTLPDGDLRATLTMVKLKAALQAWERELRDAREGNLRFEPVYLSTDAKAGSYEFVHTLLIPLLVFLPMVLAGALATDSITEEIQRNTFPLLLATPASVNTIVQAKILANVALAPILACSGLLLLSLNGILVAPAALVEILLMVTAGAYVLGALAAATGLGTRDRNKAHLIYATAFFLLFALAMAAPVSPIQAAARLASGSEDLRTHLVVVGSVVGAFAAWAALRLSLPRLASRLA